MSRPDTSIYQGLKPVPIPSPLEQVGKVLSLQEMVQRGRMNSQEMEVRNQQIEKQRQANEEEKKAAEIYRTTLDALGPDAKPEQRDNAIVDAFGRAGMAKRAQEYATTQAAVRKSLREADEATLKATHQETENKIQAANYLAQNWNILASNPDPQAFAYYLPKFAEAGMIDPNDPSIPDPKTATPDQIQAFAKSQALFGMNTKDALGHLRDVTNDIITNKQKEAQTKRDEAETKKAGVEQTRIEEETKKLKQETEEGLTEPERDFNKSYKDYIAANKLQDVPGNREKFRAIYAARKRTTSTAETEFDKRLKLIREDPKLYDKMFGREGRGDITPQDAVRVRSGIMGDIAKDLSLTTEADKKAYYERERAAFRQMGLVLPPYEPGPEPTGMGEVKVAERRAAAAKPVVTPPPTPPAAPAAAPVPKATAPPPGAPQFKPGQPVYDKTGTKLLGYFDGYENGKVALRKNP